MRRGQGAGTKVVSCCNLVSVRSLCPLCLCGEQLLIKIHHRDTECTKVAQRKVELRSCRTIANLRDLVIYWREERWSTFSYSEQRRLSYSCFYLLVQTLIG